VDPLDRIDEIIAMVEGARSVPMSRNCIMDRSNLSAISVNFRSELPGECAGPRPCSTSATDPDAGKRESDRIVIGG
jgi:hypothetical protein